MALVCAVALYANAACAQARLGLPDTYSSGLDQRLAEIGRDLFSDNRLSVDNTESCATCHRPSKIFSDGLPTAKARTGESLTRRTPSLLNVGFQTSLFWEGRSSNLIAQARVPLLSPLEHGFTDEEALIDKVVRDGAYAARLSEAFRIPVRRLRARHVVQAIAAYEQSLVAGNSAFDRYLYSNKPKAISASAIRGLELFKGRAQCAACHTIGEHSALFSDKLFHASPLALPPSASQRLPELVRQVQDLQARSANRELNTFISSDRDIAALGRFLATGNPRDIGLFKTPSLRNVALTGPYMHDGSVESLQTAVELELYTRTDHDGPPIVLTEDEQKDLVEFLKALNSS